MLEKINEKGFNTKSTTGIVFDNGLFVKAINRLQKFQNLTKIVSESGAK